MNFKKFNKVVFAKGKTAELLFQMTESVLLFMNLQLKRFQILLQAVVDVATNQQACSDCKRLDESTKNRKIIPGSPFVKENKANEVGSI
jgi:hypothetical protein